MHHPAFSTTKGICAAVDFAISGGQTKRFHTLPTIKDDLVSSHSFSVAWLLYIITAGTASSTLIMAGLAHDMAEFRTGDMPGPIKKEIGDAVNKMEARLLHDYGWQFQLTNEEALALLMADYLSGMITCILERRLGNRNLDLAYAWWDSRLSGMIHNSDYPFAGHVLMHLHDLWKEATS